MLFDLKHLKANLDLKLTQLTWTKEFFPYLYDIESRFVYDGREIIGRGCDYSIELATEKAISESIERLVCAKSNIYSNGVAIHVNPQKAALNAKMELIERDVFLSHYWFNERICGEDISDNYPLFDQAKKHYNKKGIEIFIKQLFIGNEISFAISYALGTSKDSNIGLMVGLSCSNDKDKSIFSSFIELMRNLVYFESKGKNELLSYNKFINKEAYKAQDHLHLALSPSNKNLYSHLFKKTIDRQHCTHIAPDRYKNIVTKKIDINFPIFDKYNLIIMRAQDLDLYSLTWGMPFKKHLNQVPHPIG